MIIHKFKNFLLLKKINSYTFVKNLINKNFFFLEKKNFLLCFDYIKNIKNNLHFKYKKKNILSIDFNLFFKKKIFKNIKKFRFLYSFFDFINFNFFEKQFKIINENFFFIPFFFILYDFKKKNIFFFNIIKKKILNFSKNIKKIIFNIKNIFIKNIIFKNTKNINFYIKKNVFFKNICVLKKNIKNGNITQCVISNIIYKKKKKKNLNIKNSNYNFFYIFNKIKIELFSPEFLIRYDKNKNFTKPIAGTTDKKHLNNIILNNKKEISEHIMLLDLSLNDTFKNNVKKIFLKRIIFCEHHKNLIHIVSEIYFNSIINNFNKIKNMFPAGTLSGSPKKNSIKMINKIVKKKRNYYGGIFYYINKNNIESCILIRLKISRNNNSLIESGAGIINQSINYMEWLETILKKQILLK